MPEAKPITEEQVRKYVQEDSSKCPDCGSDDIEGLGRQEADYNEVSNLIGCNKCKARWWEIFKLASIERYEP